MNYLEELENYRNREIDVLKNLNLDEVNSVMNVLDNARHNGNRIFICGNGGSAATASHYACDFNKGVNMGIVGIDGHSKNEKSIAELLHNSNTPLFDFECLSDNQATLLAVANDESYDEVFRFPLSVKMKKGDVVIGISGSGNSKNVVNALSFAKEMGGTTIAIVGYDGGKMKKMADYSIHVNINDMQIAEDIHMVLDHMMMWVFSHSEQENNR